MAKKPVLLCIMDGFGWVPEQTFGNAIAAAKRPNLDRLFETYPYTTIQASGMAVGLTLDYSLGSRRYSSVTLIHHKSYF